MNMNNIRTSAALLQAAAEALTNRDMNALEALDRISGEWLQSSDEREAQHAMLTAMMDAVEEIASL
jgi:hypothetical protein